MVNIYNIAVPKADATSLMVFGKSSPCMASVFDSSRLECAAVTGRSIVFPQKPHQHQAKHTAMHNSFYGSLDCHHRHHAVIGEFQQLHCPNCQNDGTTKFRLESQQQVSGICVTDLAFGSHQKRTGRIC